VRGVVAVCGECVQWWQVVGCEANVQMIATPGVVRLGEVQSPVVAPETAARPPHGEGHHVPLARYVVRPRRFVGGSGRCR